MFPRWHRLAILLLFLLLNLGAVPSWPARFPNSVAKTFSVQGAAALAWAKAIGFSPDKARSLDLPLSPMEVNARNIRADIPVATRSPSNQIVWDPQSQTFTITGDWLDHSTGSPSRGSRFTFGSAFIPEDMSLGGPWADLLKSWGFPRSQPLPLQFGAILGQRSSGDSFPALNLTVYRSQSWSRKPTGEWGYQVDIGVDETQSILVSP